MNEPGCFASASVFSHDSGFCKKCVSYLPCSDASLETLKRIRATVDVSALIAKHRVAREKIDLKRLELPAEVSVKTAALVAPAAPVPPTVAPLLMQYTKERLSLLIEDQQAVARLTNGKTAMVAVSLCKRGYLAFAHQALLAGKNPLDDKEGASNLKIAMQMLIQGGFTQKDLRDRYIAEKGWSKGTSDTQASMAVAILTAFELTQQVGDTFMVAKGKE